jgi:oligopeptide/dipeptide ABC transporter ATP-binding protein
MPPVLQVKNLVTRFHTADGVVHAVNGVSFDVEQGETLAIVGESGSGKSVTMMSLLRLIPGASVRIVSGEALFNNGSRTVDLLKLGPGEIRQVRGGQVGFIFQDPLSSLNPVLTIGQQISESIIEHNSTPEPQAKERTIELLAKVGIPDAASRYNSYPHQFSGGMRQRVMIAIAIACNPKILIADEPTTALDVTIQAQIVDLVLRLQVELGMSVIWITHDLGIVAGLAKRVLVMYAGRVAEQALVDDLYEQPRHPYTIGLLGALPRLDASQPERLVNIKGSPPDLRIEPRHCQFAFRCPYAFEKCWNELPPPVSVGHVHSAACFYDVEKGEPRHGR